MTFKVDGAFVDYMIGTDQAAEIADLMLYTLGVPDEVAQANDQSPSQN